MPSGRWWRTTSRPINCSLALTGSPGFTPMRRTYSNLCYYIVAHQDDWQLFYGQQAFSDLIEPGARVVFIYTTAGDAGGSEDWWRAREQGALAAQSLTH